ncbi:MAG: CPP1-like family protein, partial [Cyanobacteria bacterium]|nr:CPP1-like family protein [Cyanobacteriota bacterium]MDW8203196.1 CPP1-like family protein [Cyanobacteriota bacterium SKYGB_h_bin112]
RQEGKIKVPDVIRFPEKNAAPAPRTTATAARPMPAWIERLADDPERPDIIYPAVINLGLSALLILFPSPDGAAVQVSLAIAVGACLYFLNRKERKFGRALLLTLVGLIVGLGLGAMVSSGLAGMLNSVGMPLLSATAVVTLFVLWFVSSFLR